MKRRPDNSPIWDAWQAGGVLAGPNLRSNGYVTVEPGYQLNAANVGFVLPGGTNADPVRWFQRADNSQLEVVVPNVVSIDVEHNLDTDVDSATVVIDNNWLGDPTRQNPDDLGSPGFFSPERGRDATNRWGHVPGFWTNLLGRNALLRTYEGYGGHGKTLNQALADGNVVQTGAWLVDDPQVSTDGKLTLKCRSTAKLLVDQDVYPPLIPAHLYPPAFSRFFRREVDNPKIVYGRFYTARPQKEIVGLAETAAGDGYWIAGNDGGVFSYGNTYFHGSLGGVPLWLALRDPEVRMVGIARSPDNPAGSNTFQVPGQSPEVLPASGYWLALNTGHVYHYGDATDHGGVGLTLGLDNIVGIMRAGNLDGYWLVRADGSIFSFGAASYYGGANHYTISGHIAGYASSPSGNGYWLCDSGGQVFSFGDAAYHGGVHTTLAAPIVAMAASSSGNGYYLVGSDGGVFCFGDAVYHGSIPGLTVPWTYPDGTIHGGSTELNTWLADFQTTDVGLTIKSEQQNPDGTDAVFPAGTTLSRVHGGTWVSVSNPARIDANPLSFTVYRPLVLNDPIVGMAVTPDNGGYWLLGADGGVFTFGDAVFHGSLPGISADQVQYDGNYRDLADIIRFFALWAGFNFFGSGSDVYGNIESTGIYSPDILDGTLFDKAPVMDGMKKIRDVVGYLLYVDDEGALRFTEPNYWESGNVLPDGTRVPDVPVIDEKIQLTSYQLSEPDADFRSEIIVGNEDPFVANGVIVPGTVYASYSPPEAAAALKGMVKAALYVNPVFVNQAENGIMAHLIANHINFRTHQGSLKMLANPLIQVDDQVQVLERQAAETNVHWVRAVKSTNDLRTGEYQAQLTLTFLNASSGPWMVVKPTGAPSGNLVVNRTGAHGSPPGPPGAPAAPTAVAGDAQATVSWSAPISTGGSALTGYDVTASPSGRSVSVGAGVTSTVVPGLVNGVTYTFVVTATNAASYTGPPSAPSNAVTPQAVAGGGGTGTGKRSVMRYLAINQDTSVKVSTTDATNNDVIVAQPNQVTGTGHTPAELLAANAALLLLQYMNGTHAVPADFGPPLKPHFAPDDTWYLWTGPNHTGHKLVTGANIAMDPRSPGWIGYKIAQALAILASDPHWGGVFVDVLGKGALGAMRDQVTGAPAVPWNPRTAAPYTAQDWSDDCATLGAAIYEGMGADTFGGGPEMVANGLQGAASYYGNPPSWVLIGRPAYAALAEVFLRQATDDPTAFPAVSGFNSFAQAVQMVADATTARGGIFYAILKLWRSATSTQVEAWQRLGLGTILLGTKGYRYCALAFETSAGDHTAYPYFNAALGEPSAPADLSATVWTRPFTAGRVAVNPSAGAAPVTLPAGNWTDVDGTVYSGTVTVPAHWAFLLTGPT